MGHPTSNGREARAGFPHFRMGIPGSGMPDFSETPAPGLHGGCEHSLYCRMQRPTGMSHHAMPGAPRVSSSVSAQRTHGRHTIDSLGCVPRTQGFGTVGLAYGPAFDQHRGHAVVTPGDVDPDFVQKTARCYLFLVEAP